MALETFRFRFASLALSAVVATFALAGCAADPQSDESAAAAESEVRSVATGFFVRAPLSGRRLEHLRQELGTAEELGSFDWTRNQGSSHGVQWESSKEGALSAAERASLAQAAFAFEPASSKEFLKDLEVVAPTDEALGKALDAIGFDASMTDEETEAERAALLAALKDVARTRSITVMTAKLEYQPDMYWEGALVVIDEENQQILFATGGYGT